MAVSIRAVAAINFSMAALLSCAKYCSGWLPLLICDSNKDSQTNRGRNSDRNGERSQHTGVVATSPADNPHEDRYANRER